MRFLHGMRFLPVAFVVALVTWPAFGGKLEIDSQPTGAAFEVDGDLAEWQDTMTFIKSERVYLGVANDDEHVYLAMQSRDGDVNRAVVMSGLIVRLDTGGKKALGIEYPTGVMASSGSRSRNRPQSRQEIAERFRASLGSFTVTGPGKKDRETLPVDDGRGIEVACDVGSGGFIYELKVPLRRTEVHPYAIGASPNAVLRVTVDTPQINVAAMREQSDAGRASDPTGRGGMGGYGGDDRTGMNDELSPGSGATVRADLPPSVRFKAKIRLSEPAD
jgi:hypothetical protein